MTGHNLRTQPHCFCDATILVHYIPSFTMTDMIWPPTAELNKGRFHIIVEIWEPLSPSLRKYKLAVLISKLRLNDRWTVHIPETLDGPYGVFYSGDDKADFEKELVILKSIKEGCNRKGTGISFRGDRFAYTKLTAYSLPMNSFKSGSAVADSDTDMELEKDGEVPNTDSGTTLDDARGISGETSISSSTRYHRSDSSEQQVRDHQMEDAENVLDEAILELDKEEKAAKEGFDALVEQFQLLTGNDADNVDKSLHFGAV